MMDDHDYDADYDQEQDNANDDDDAYITFSLEEVITWLDMYLSG